MKDVPYSDNLKEYKSPAKQIRSSDKWSVFDPQSFRSNPIEAVEPELTSPESPFKVSTMKSRVSISQFKQIEPIVHRKERLVKLNLQNKKELSQSLLGSINHKNSKSTNYIYNNYNLNKQRKSRHSSFV